MFPIQQNMWLRIDPAPELQELEIDDGITHRLFGNTIGDFQLLSEFLPIHGIFGLVLFHVDRKTTTVFISGKYPISVGVGSGLSWVRKFGAMGILIRKQVNDHEFAFVDALWEQEQHHRTDDHRSAVMSVLDDFKYIR